MLKTVRGAVNIKYWWIPDGKTLMGAVNINYSWIPYI